MCASPKQPTGPLSGTLRSTPEDFQVEEIPLYPPSGDGEHLMVQVEKRELTTPAMISLLAKELKVSPRNVGWAGYKDRHAVTRQWITLPGNQDPERVLALELPGIAIKQAHRHRNKIRTGHLRGNRFLITVRDTVEDAATIARSTLEKLPTRGLKNAFGPQRFGTLGNNHLVAACLVRGDGEGFLRLLSTPDEERETPRIIEARKLLGEGRYDEAGQAFPGGMALEKHLARRLAKGDDLPSALRRAPRNTLSILASAWQSAIFNATLEARADSYDALLPGDVAMKHQNGASFLVEDLAAEAPRVQSFEISPTGPLPGRKMLEAQEEAGRIETEVMAGFGAHPFPKDTSLLPAATLEGARRALRVPVEGLEIDAPEAGTLRLGFGLPKGSFATALLMLLGLRDG